MFSEFAFHDWPAVITTTALNQNFGIIYAGRSLLTAYRPVDSKRIYRSNVDRSTLNRTILVGARAFADLDDLSNELCRPN